MGKHSILRIVYAAASRKGRDLSCNDLFSARVEANGAGRFTNGQRRRLLAPQRARVAHQRARRCYAQLGRAAAEVTARRRL